MQPRPHSPVLMLGIDPGLRACGWGLVALDGSRLSHVGHGVIRPDPDMDLSDRLLALAQGVREVLGAHACHAAAIEETFVNAENARSALHLGHARAAAMIACAEAGLMVAEYAPRVVKKSVVGTGTADKQQMIAMIARLLPAARNVPSDAADALAVAICALHHGHGSRRPGAAA